MSAAERLTDGELGDIKLIVETIVSTAMPAILKAVAVARGGEVHAVGELLHAAPAEEPRDYRKGLWISVYARHYAKHCSRLTATNAANEAVDEFDRKFKQ